MLNSQIMTTKELYDLIKRHGTVSGLISGCKLLGFISDVPGFVSLLGGFYHTRTDWNVRVLKPRACDGFVAKYPKPVNTILNDDITFYAGSNVLGIWHGSDFYERQQNDD